MNKYLILLLSIFVSTISSAQSYHSSMENEVFDNAKQGTVIVVEKLKFKHKGFSFAVAANEAYRKYGPKTCRVAVKVFDTWKYDDVLVEAWKRGPHDICSKGKQWSKSMMTTWEPYWIEKGEKLVGYRPLSEISGKQIKCIRTQLETAKKFLSRTKWAREFLKTLKVGAVVVDLVDNIKYKVYNKELSYGPGVITQDDKKSVLALDVVINSKRKCFTSSYRTLYREFTKWKKTYIKNKNTDLTGEIRTKATGLLDQLSR